MKKHLVSYATCGYRPAQELLEKSAMEFGIDNVFTYWREDIIRTKLYKENKKVLDKMRYAGYALWKPFIILDAINKINDNDILVYCDCDMVIIGDLTPLFDICANKSGIMLFGGNNGINKQGVKRDCFVLMNCDSERF